MSLTTNIEWATSTGNPWIGCTKVSAGCKNCYAETLDAQRFSKTMGGGTKENPVSHWGKGAPRFKTKAFWKDAIKWNREATWKCVHCGYTGPNYDPPGRCNACTRADLFDQPRPRIFPSLCDWLDDEVPTEWLGDFLQLIHRTPNLDWLLLTKRPENFRRRLQHVEQDAARVTPHEPDSVKVLARRWQIHGVPANVWVGTSVEDQDNADKRIPELLKIPAQIRFLSCEPLLGPVNLGFIENDGYKLNCLTGEQKDMGRPCHSISAIISWVIVGGESGKQARRCNIDWIRSVVSRCNSASVPVFVKQLGGNLGDADLSECSRAVGKSLAHPKGGDPAEWPEDLRIREFPSVTSVVASPARTSCKNSGKSE